MPVFKRVKYTRCLHDINIKYCRYCTNLSIICPHNISKVYCIFCPYEFDQPYKVSVCCHGQVEGVCLECLKYKRF